MMNKITALFVFIYISQCSNIVHCFSSAKKTLKDILSRESKRYSSGVTCDIEVAKQNLRQALENNENSTDSIEVKEAVDVLTNLNANPVFDETLFVGNWLTLSAPNFPGRIKSDSTEIFQYTLGRLSFSMFKPEDLVCTLLNAYNIVATRDSDDDQKFEYIFENHIDILTKNGKVLPALLITNATCKAPESDGKIRVKFCDVVLKPIESSSNEYLKLWTNTFEGANEKTDISQQKQSKRLRKFARKICKKLRLKSYNQTEVSEGYRINFEQAINGWVEILFIDNEIRVTRGNAGTIVVNERL